MQICVMGLWHLGCVVSVSLSSIGHKVVGFDKSSETVKNLIEGKAPIFEPDLDQMIQDQLEKKTLSFVDKYEEIHQEIRVLWVTYDTPVDENDVADTDFVISEVVDILPSIPKNTVIVISSQLPVGSVAQIQSISDKNFPEKGLKIACIPENLRLGVALDIFLNPDRVIIGCDDLKTKAILAELFEPLKAKLIWMSTKSAEMTKHAINSFLATSISFANEIAAICEFVGADAFDVVAGLKTDQRIGPKAYLSPGGAFDGGTLARDIDYLIKISKGEVDTKQLLATKVSNDLHKMWVKKKLENIYKSLSGLKVSVWGLTYKPNTNTLRRSTAVELCSWLLSKGVSLSVYDPVIKDLPALWHDQVSLKTYGDSLIDIDVLIVMTPWPIFKDHAKAFSVNQNKRLLVLDPNSFIRNILEKKSFRVLSVGRTEVDTKNETS